MEFILHPPALAAFFGKVCRIHWHKF